jgi:hypothetical protein
LAETVSVTGEAPTVPLAGETESHVPWSGNATVAMNAVVKLEVN